MRTTLKAKIIMILVFITFLFFFSNDFGLIDVEKTSIITAIAIDKSNEEFTVTAQIAVPEATDTNSENLKAQLSGKGSTVGAALKDLGDVSGWFPKLAFCNLILLGNSLTQTNVIEALDYFAKTLRVQDSALVALAENSAKDLLSVTTPLDNISAFALQKVMFKTQGFDRDVASTDIKSFCAGHYSLSGSAFMPLIKTVSSGDNTSDESSSSSSAKGGAGSESSSGGSGGKSSDKLFDARTTALFKDGFKVGELDPELTLMFNALTENFAGTTLPVDGVTEPNGKSGNYLLTVMSSTPKISLSVGEDLTINISLKLYCKISDHASEGSKEALSQNTPLPKPLKEKAQQMLTDRLNDLVEVEKQTGCDFLKIKEKLYRYHHKQYSKFKDNYLSVLKTKISVTVEGQK